MLNTTTTMAAPVTRYKRTAKLYDDIVRVEGMLAGYQRDLDAWDWRIAERSVEGDANENWLRYARAARESIADGLIEDRRQLDALKVDLRDRLAREAAGAPMTRRKAA